MIDASPNRLASRLPLPPVPLAAAVLAIQRLSGRGRPVTKASSVLAGIFLAGSVWSITGAIAEFRRQRTTVNPVEVGAASLLTSGPNRVTRNPMYVGMAGILISHALLRWSPMALLAAMLFVAAIDRLQIPVEEALLRDRFGSDFDTYARTTPRWISPGGLQWCAARGQS